MSCIPQYDQGGLKGSGTKKKGGGGGVDGGEGGEGDEATPAGPPGAKAKGKGKPGEDKEETFYDSGALLAVTCCYLLLLTVTCCSDPLVHFPGQTFPPPPAGDLDMTPLSSPSPACSQEGDGRETSADHSDAGRAGCQHPPGHGGAEAGDLCPHQADRWEGDNF